MSKSKGRKTEMKSQSDQIRPITVDHRHTHTPANSRYGFLCGTSLTSAGYKQQSETCFSLPETNLPAVASPLLVALQLGQEALKAQFWRRGGTKVGWEIIFTASLFESRWMNKEPSPTFPPPVDAHVTEPQERLGAAPPPAAVWLSFFPLRS